MIWHGQQQSIRANGHYSLTFADVISSWREDRESVREEQKC